MEKYLLFGLILFITGALMSIFRRSFSVWFCKSGKDSLKNSKYFDSNDIDSIYDEKTAPSKIFFVGISIMVGGLLTIFLGTLIKIFF